MDVFVSVRNRTSGTPHTKVRCKRQKTNRFNEKRQKEGVGEKELDTNGEVKAMEK